MPTLQERRLRRLERNNAQDILKRLEAFGAKPQKYIKRWIWELLQNALDARGKDQQLVVSVESCHGYVCFQHNGRGFTTDEAVSLIYHGSSKVEDKEAIGQFGSGFLTTYLLSSRTEISGKLEDNRPFSFSLTRETGSVDNMISSMEKAFNEFEGSIGNPIACSEFTTCFRFPVAEAVEEVVRNGISDLRRCAPFVLLFNEKISEIAIKSANDRCVFRIENCESNDDQVITKKVTEKRDGESTETEYALVQGKLGSIAVSLDDDVDLDDIPKIFLSFPLVGTEDYSFPAIINSSRFFPTEDRDGVWLGTSDLRVGGAGAATTRCRVARNQKIVSESSELLVKLFGFLIVRENYPVYKLAYIPSIDSIVQRDWIDRAWFKDHVKNLIERIRTTPSVINREGEFIAPQNATMPMADVQGGVDVLWGLASELTDLRPGLPRREQAFGWCKAVKSWVPIRGCGLEDLVDAWDGGRLAEWIEKKTQTEHREVGSQCKLRELLAEGGDPVEWLDRLCAFLVSNGFGEDVAGRAIIPNQKEHLLPGSILYRDNDVAEELKDIADSLPNIYVRLFLRDTRLTSVPGEIGKGDQASGDVVCKIVERLEKETAFEGVFAEASVRLFEWIVNNSIGELLGFPGFSADGRLLRVGADEYGAVPFAPVQTWADELMKYEELFPPRRILASQFYNTAPDVGFWNALSDRGLVRTSPVALVEMSPFVAGSRRQDVFLPDEPDDDRVHEASERVARTDVAYLSDVMKRLGGNRQRARMFWRFLVYWLIRQRPNDLEYRVASCRCGAQHRYYTAAWIGSVIEDRWVPLEDNRRAKANAKSLTALFDDHGVPLSKDDVVSRFLDAIRVSPLDLAIGSLGVSDGLAKIVTETRGNAEVISTLVPKILAASEGNAAVLGRIPQILDAAGGDLAVLGMVPEIIAAAGDQPDLIGKVPEVVEQLRSDRFSKRVLDSRRLQIQLGDLVAGLVENSLGGYGFEVIRRGTPPSRRFGDVGELSLSREGRQWKVTIKAVRSEHDLLMTSAQAIASMQNTFLLCVVEDDDAWIRDNVEAVAENMTFVQDVGRLVDPLHADIDSHVGDGVTEEISSPDDPRVRLEIKPGEVRLCVAREVLAEDGFGLGKLAERLLENGGYVC